MTQLEEAFKKYDKSLDRIDRAASMTGFLCFLMPMALTILSLTILFISLKK